MFLVFFVIFFERIFLHWKNVCLGRNQLTNILCFSILIAFSCSIAELLLLFPVVQMWCFMVKKGLRMKCVMLFPKYNIRNKISTHTSFSYITWYYNSAVAATNKKAYIGDYLLQVFIQACLDVLKLWCWCFASSEHKQDLIFLNTSSCKCALNSFGTSVCLSLWP